MGYRVSAAEATLGVDVGRQPGGFRKCRPECTNRRDARTARASPDLVNSRTHQLTADPSGWWNTMRVLTSPWQVVPPDITGMVLIQGGEFTMGTDSREPFEGPPHPVRLGSFSID